MIKDHFLIIWIGIDAATQLLSNILTHYQRMSVLTHMTLLEVPTEETDVKFSLITTVSDCWTPNPVHDRKTNVLCTSGERWLHCMRVLSKKVRAWSGIGNKLVVSLNLKCSKYILLTFFANRVNAPMKLLQLCLVDHFFTCELVQYFLLLSPFYQ